MNASARVILLLVACCLCGSALAQEPASPAPVTTPTPADAAPEVRPGGQTGGWGQVGAYRAADETSGACIVASPPGEAARELQPEVVLQWIADSSARLIVERRDGSRFWKPEPIGAGRYYSKPVPAEAFAAWERSGQILPVVLDAAQAAELGLRQEDLTFWVLLGD